MARKPKSYDDILNGAYRWPKTGDRLLRASGDWDRGVSFATDVISRHVHIWSGYFSAGAALIEAAENDHGEGQILIYPVLFSYRHGIELAMKWVIMAYGRHTGVSGTGVEHHDLWKLWTLCKKVIEDGGGTDEAVAIVEQVIKDFHDLDKSALAFRYSRDRNGTLYPLPDTLIDLKNLRDVMEAVSHFFDGVDGLLDWNTGAVDWTP
jgi:hypothetical protein